MFVAKHPSRPYMDETMNISVPVSWQVECSLAARAECPIVSSYLAIVQNRATLLGPAPVGETIAGVCHMWCVRSWLQFRCHHLYEL